MPSEADRRLLHGSLGFSYSDGVSVDTKLMLLPWITPAPAIVVVPALTLLA